MGFLTDIVRASLPAVFFADALVCWFQRLCLTGAWLSPSHDAALGALAHTGTDRAPGTEPRRSHPRMADDTLALALDGTEVRCLPVCRELRLRPATAELLAGGVAQLETADGQVPVLALSETLAATTLSGIVVPAAGVDHRESIEGLEERRPAPPCWAAHGSSPCRSRTTPWRY